MKFSHAVSSGFVSCTALALLMTVGSAHAQKTPQEPITHDFETLDVNDDGYISRIEADDENVWYHFPAIDKDRDQALSKQEFVEYIVEEEPLLGEELPLSKLPQAYLRERTQDEDDADVVTNPALLPKIETEFSDLDNDGDTFLSRDETDDDDIYEHFTRMDLNSDSLVSEYEFESYLREYGTIVATEEVVEQALYE